MGYWLWKARSSEDWPAKRKPIRWFCTCFMLCQICHILRLRWPTGWKSGHINYPAAADRWKTDSQAHLVPCLCFIFSNNSFSVFNSILEDDPNHSFQGVVQAPANPRADSWVNVAQPTAAALLGWKAFQQQTLPGHFFCTWWGHILAIGRCRWWAAGGSGDHGWTISSPRGIAERERRALEEKRCKKESQEIRRELTADQMGSMHMGRG